MLLNLRLFPKKIRQAGHLYLSASPFHGTGVFSHKAIRKGEIIEKAPVILIDATENDILKHTALYHYYFLVNKPETPVAIGLGYSSLYNHSCPSNAGYKIKTGKSIIIIKAARDIAPGEEITINYNGEPGNDAPVQFPDK